MTTLNKLVNQKEMKFYIFVGLLSTAVDWSSFTIAVEHFSIHYQLALVIAVFFGGLTHYTANKLFTFKCSSKQYTSQIFLYVIISAVSLACSMMVLAFLVKYLFASKVIARMMTTGIMLFPNYMMHKYITFNKRIFAQ